MRPSKEGSTIAEAVRHPLRIRILEVLNERDMSPSQFVKAGYADFFFGHRPEPNHIAYHFRELEGYGCLEEVAWRKSRGSIMRTYRGKARAAFADAEWSELSEKEKRDISRTVARGLIARIDGAFIADTFLTRDDHQLSWFAMQLDERGWTEAHEVLAEAFADVSRIHADARARLSESGERGVSATAGILFFESPGPTPPVRLGLGGSLGCD